MPEPLLGFLKLCLLALIYLFFARVLWAVWNEVRAARTTASADATAQAHTTDSAAAAAAARRRSRASTAPPTRLAGLEPPAIRGHSFPITRELTIGRAPGCAVSLPGDTFVSLLHTRVYQESGQVWVEDLGSTNGTYLNGFRLGTAVQLHRGDKLQVGSGVLEAA